MKISNIAKNTSYFTLALIIQKAIAFAFFTVLARNFAAADLGKYYFAISFTTIFSVFADLGLANVLTREAAKKSLTESPNQTKKTSATAIPAEVSVSQDNTSHLAPISAADPNSASSGINSRLTVQNLLSTAIAIKLPLAFLSALAIAATINLMGYPEVTKRLVYLSLVCMALDSFTLIFFSAIRAFRNLKYESLGSVFFQLIALIFGLIFIKSKAGLAWVMSALIAASLFNFVYSAYLVRYKWRLSLKPVFDRPLMKYLLGITVVFGIFGVLQRLWTYFDSVLLSLLAGDYYVGIYQIAFKIINALQFLPLAFTASLYPAMAVYWKHNREQLAITFERAMNYLLIISLPLAIGIIALADKIIMLFKSGYQEALLPLQISISSLVFLFLLFPIGSLLNACDRQKANTLNLFITFLASIMLNIILIPYFKAIGASITVLLTNILMFALGLRYVPKITAYNYRKNLIMFVKALSCAALMGIFCVYFKNYFNIIIVVLASGGIYFSALYLLKGFTLADITSIWQSFKKSDSF